MEKGKDQIVHGSMKRKIVASDLLAERANINFDKEDMATVIL